MSRPTSRDDLNEQKDGLIAALNRYKADFFPHSPAQLPILTPQREQALVARLAAIEEELTALRTAGSGGGEGGDRTSSPAGAGGVPATAAAQAAAAQEGKTPAAAEAASAAFTPGESEDLAQVFAGGPFVRAGMAGLWDRTTAATAAAGS